jgi:hypothetical protein
MSPLSPAQNPQAGFRACGVRRARRSGSSRFSFRRPYGAIKSLLRGVWCVSFLFVGSFETRFCLFPVFEGSAGFNPANPATPF